MTDLQQQKLEVLTYYMNGSVYAETVLELDPPDTKTLPFMKNKMESIHFIIDLYHLVAIIS